MNYLLNSVSISLDDSTDDDDNDDGSDDDVDSSSNSCNFYNIPSSHHQTYHHSMPSYHYTSRFASFLEAPAELQRLQDPCIL